MDTRYLMTADVHPRTARAEEIAQLQTPGFAALAQTPLAITVVIEVSEQWARVDPDTGKRDPACGYETISRDTVITVTGTASHALDELRAKLSVQPRGCATKNCRIGKVGSSSTIALDEVRLIRAARLCYLSTQVK